jgi:predicted RNA binding protein YcfA (HicA-like mRNA interferase family)
MEKLSPVSWNNFVTRLKELGFEGPFFGGRHPKMRKNKLTIIIPNKHEGDIGVGFLTRLLRQAGISKEEWIGKNQSGLSIIATVLTLLLFSVFIAVAVSLITTGAHIGVQEEQGQQAFYIAEGGIQYALKRGSYCTFSEPSTSLGTGNFTVASQENTAITWSTIDNVTNPVDIPWTTLSSSFTLPGTIKIDNEYLFCDWATSNSFIGCRRAVAWSTIASHASNSTVYQCVVTSTGTVSTGILFGNVQRVVQATVGE